MRFKVAMLAPPIVVLLLVCAALLWGGQAAPTPAPVLIYAGPWTPMMVTALFGGIVLVISAVGKLYFDLRKSRREDAERAEERAAEAFKLRAAVDANTRAADGHNSALVERIRDLTAQVAVLSGRKADLDAAATAERDAAAKAALTQDTAVLAEAAEHVAEKKG